MFQVFLTDSRPDYGYGHLGALAAACSQSAPDCQQDQDGPLWTSGEQYPMSQHPTGQNVPPAPKVPFHTTGPWQWAVQRSGRAAVGRRQGGGRHSRHEISPLCSPRVAAARLKPSDFDSALRLCIACLITSALLTRQLTPVRRRPREPHLVDGTSPNNVFMASSQRLLLLT